MPRRKTPAPTQGQHEYVHIANGQLYHATQNILAKRTFGKTPDSPFPRAVIAEGQIQGAAELRPVIADGNRALSPEEVSYWGQRMWSQVETLGDLTVDVMDILTAIWLERAGNNPGARIEVTVDEICARRGLKKRPGANGRRGGYAPQQRAAIVQAIFSLNYLWLDAEGGTVYDDQAGPVKLTIHNRPWIMTSIITQERLLDHEQDLRAFRFIPGDVFAEYLLGPGRQTAMLSTKALHYNPVKQTYEKRMLRYLCYQWRVRARTGNYLQPFKVTTLLTNIGLEPDQRNAWRTKERLEKCLDTLLEDNAIKDWRYADTWDENLVGTRGWLREWLQIPIIITPPDEIVQAYKALTGPEKASAHALTGFPDIGAAVRAARTRLGISQAQLAKELRVSQMYVSKIETGKVKSMSREVFERLTAWLDAHSRQ